MWVRFLKAYDYTPSRERRVTTAYPAGYEGSVKRECGEAAIQDGAAEEIEAPAREQAPEQGGEPVVPIAGVKKRARRG